MRTHRVRQLILTALMIGALSACCAEETTQAIAPINEQTTNDTRAEKITTIQSSTPSDVTVTGTSETQEATQYPKQIHGKWMEGATTCRSPINYDSEMLLIIDPDMLGQYENTSKPITVDQISNHPPTWKVISTVSPGTAEYSGRYIEIFTLIGSQLKIKFNGATTTYTRCN